MLFTGCSRHGRLVAGSAAWDAGDGPTPGRAEEEALVPAQDSRHRRARRAGAAPHRRPGRVGRGRSPGRTSRPADLRRRPPPGRPRRVRRPAPGLGHGRAARPRDGLQRRAHAGAVRLVPRPDRPADRRRPGRDRDLLRRHVQPRPAARGHDVVCRREARGAGRPHRGPRPRPEPARRRSGPDRPAGLGARHDRSTADPAEPGPPAGRPAHLPSGAAARVPEGQHGLRGRPPGRPADRLVGQAPGVRDPRRAVGHRRPGPLHPGDQQHRPGRHRRLDDRQRRDAAVRRLQGAGRAQRNRRLRPRPDAPGRDARGVRAELPVRVDRAEAADVGGRAGRLPAGRAGPGAGPRRGTGLRRRPHRRVRGRAAPPAPRSHHDDHPVGQARPVADRSRRADPRRRRQAARRPERRVESRRTPAPATSSRRRSTTTRCCSG